MQHYWSTASSHQHIWVDAIDCVLLLWRHGSLDVTASDLWDLAHPYAVSWTRPPRGESRGFTIYTGTKHSKRWKLPCLNSLRTHLPIHPLGDPINSTFRNHAQRHTGHPLNSKVLWNTIICHRVFNVHQAYNPSSMQYWIYNELNQLNSLFNVNVNLYIMHLCVCCTVQDLHENRFWWMQHSCFK